MFNCYFYSDFKFVVGNVEGNMSIQRNCWY